MAQNENNAENAFMDDPELSKKTLNTVPKPAREIGIDIDNQFIDDFIYAGETSLLDTGKIESFTQVSQNRDTIYQLLDTMSEDSTISAVLETYAEDATETNDAGQIMWCESDDDKIAKYVSFLLDDMNVDKNIYKWTYSLCKYGDVYLKLYHLSEFDDSLFDEAQKHNNRKLNEALEQHDGQDRELNEDIKVKLFQASDNYAHYLEMVPNPAEMFELTRFGKTYAYIKADISSNVSKNQESLINSAWRYSFKKRDVEVSDATTYVHAALEDNSPRVPEEVSIFLPKDGINYNDETDQVITYTVKRGQSILYNSFKIWRETMLLDNALLLNRITKSSILRVINVQVGDMPKEMVGPHLQGIKNLIEQKTAINTGNSLSEYTNPGPMENNIYIPVRHDQGSISTEQIGGDVEVGKLYDIEYFRDRLFSSLKVPKQFFGFTEDGAGFNGGESLTILSSRYAKTIKRIQNAMIQAITDAINLMLLDKGLDSYINKFQLHMVPPTTQDEITRRDNLASKIQVAGDIMNLLDDVNDGSARLLILKSLLQGAVNDPEIVKVIEDQIKTAEEAEKWGIDTTDDSGEGDVNTPSVPSAGGAGASDAAMTADDFDALNDNQQDNGELPSPNDLGIDMTDNNMEI